MAAFAVGAVAFADVLLFLLNEHAVAGNGHVKAAFALENNTFSAETAQQERGFEGVNSRRMWAGYVPYVNENAFAVCLVALKKLNKCRGLGRIEAGRNRNVEVVVAETVA